MKIEHLTKLLDAEYDAGFAAGVEAAANHVLNGARIPGYRALEINLPPGLMTHIAATIRVLAAPVEAHGDGARCKVCGDTGYVTTDPKEPEPECDSCDYWERRADGKCDHGVSLTARCVACEEDSRKPWPKKEKP